MGSLDKLKVKHQLGIVADSSQAVEQLELRD